jgi:hypothetical protein
MRILSLLILAVLLIAMQKIKSPHGQAFKAECAVCHSTKGWQLDREIYSFRHDTTRFPLAGQHSALNCRDCHRSLVFSEADHLCSGCHRDVHQSTLGQDCSRCHTPSSWLVNIYQIHDLSRFPLLGMHRITDCAECHRSENPVRFDIIGSECIDCHRQEYLSASPNHIQSGFSEDCNTCHNVYSLHWEGAGFNHNFFPLTSGHSSLACTDCHDGQNYQAASRECSSCHLEEYNSTSNPAHIPLNFPWPAMNAILRIRVGNLLHTRNMIVNRFPSIQGSIRVNGRHAPIAIHSLQTTLFSAALPAMSTIKLIWTMNTGVKPDTPGRQWCASNVTGTEKLINEKKTFFHIMAACCPASG